MMNYKIHKYLILTPNGEFEIEDVNHEEDNLRAYYRMINCDCIDIVSCYGFDKIMKSIGYDKRVNDYCLIVDDEGLYKPDAQVNPYASLLYGIIDHGQPLVGRVVVAKNIVTDEGLDTGGLDTDDIFAIMSAITDLMNEYNSKGQE